MTKRFNTILASASGIAILLIPVFDQHWISDNNMLAALIEHRIFMMCIMLGDTMIILGLLYIERKLDKLQQQSGQTFFIESPTEMTQIKTFVVTTLAFAWILITAKGFTHANPFFTAVIDDTSILLLALTAIILWDVIRALRVTLRLR